MLKKLYLDGASYKDIAKIMGISRASVYRKLKKENIVNTRRGYEDLTGKQYGSLIVEQYRGKGRYSYGGTFHKWQCRCNCGNIVVVLAGNLKQGQQTCKKCAATTTQKKLTKYPIDYNIWYRIVKRSNERAMFYDVTPDYLWKLYIEQNKKCALTGVEIYFGEKRQNPSTASVDRIDSNKGYIKGNVRWVHRIVNIMRNTMSDKELIQWCNLIVTKSQKETSECFHITPG